MKKYIPFLAFVLLAACAENKETNNNTENPDLLSTDIVVNEKSANGVDSVALGKLPTMDFTDTVHDFGNVDEGEIVQHDFTFTNNGAGPLIIHSAAGSCGCTVPEYPREPLAPGESAVMKVKFNSEGKPNHQEKTVTIHDNTGRGMHMLFIKADVKPAK